MLTLQSIYKCSTDRDRQRSKYVPLDFLALTARSTARLRRNTIPDTTATPSKKAVTADAALELDGLLGGAGGDLLGGRGGEGGGGGGGGAGAGACSHASVSLGGRC